MEKTKGRRKKHPKGTSAGKEFFSSLPTDFWWVIRQKVAVDWQVIGKPFTQKWKKFWGMLVQLKGTIHEEGKGAGEWSALDPGAASRFEKFEKKDGFAHLKALAGHGADANFILNLFVRYLWNEKVSTYDHDAPYVRASRDTLRSLPGNMEEYRLLTAGGQLRRNVKFERAVYTMEEHLAQVLSRREFSDVRYSPQHDKANRVIFTIHKHLKGATATGQPHWRLFLALLISADVIKTGKKKRKPGDKRTAPIVEPSSLITGRIRRFEQSHRREATEIEILVGLLYPPL